MNSTAEKKGFVLALALLFILALALNVLTPFAADDYTYSFSFQTGERITRFSQLLPSLAAHGHVMNGRYAPHFFVQLFTMLPAWIFDVLNAGMLVLFVGGLYALVRGEKRYHLALLLALGCGTLLCLPDFGGPMLWLSGSLNYLWVGTLCLWLLKPCADVLLNRGPRPSRALIPFLCLGALLAGNASENMSATLALLLLGSSLYQFLHARKGYGWMALTGCFALAGWLLLILAPGDSGRISGIAAGGLGFYMERFMAAMERWREYLLPLSVLYLFLLAAGVVQKAPAQRLWLSGGLAAAAFVCNGVMMLSDYYPLRTVLWPVMLMLAACGAAAAVLEGKGRALWLGGTASLCLLAVLAMAVALPNDYNRYRQYQARTEDILLQRQTGETHIQTFGVLSHSKYDMFNDLMELTTQDSYRVNQSMARYYQVETIVADRFE